jgi:thiosulfate/3-mercaptopyruvate sulfurtransferase
MYSANILIEPSELNDALDKRAVFLVDARRTGEFKNGHIPGAIPLSTYETLVPNTTLEGMRVFTESMASRFSSVGVTNNRPVVVYDEETGMRAARELWILEYMGHQNARMLHGGLKHWIAAGGTVVDDTEIPTVRPRTLRTGISSGCFANLDEVSRRAGSWNCSVLDVRDDLEWIGQKGSTCCPRQGHIPNAVHIEWTQFLENGRFKSPEAIAEVLEANGINPRHDIITYCHRGARSANTYYALRYSGIMCVRNYIGSWHEWSIRADLPLAK